MKRADLAPDGKPREEPRAILDQGNPRFPSAAFDGKGRLWAAWSEETSLGREIAVRDFGKSAP